MEQQVDVVTREDVELEYLALLEEVEQMEYRLDPVKWVVERLGEHVWSKQRLIMESVRDNRHTSVPSCFGSGKSWIAARIAAWWLDTHPVGSAFVVTTATTGAQVKAILWREIHRAHAAGELPGRLNKTEWWMETDDGREEIVAFGRKPGDLDSTAFQGIHARWVLVIGDEAAGLNRTLIEAADSLVVNEESRMLLIGNPENAVSEFAEVCKPGSGHNVIQIKAWETPNFTSEDVPAIIKQSTISQIWVETKRKRWGEKNPMWLAKVEAEFPSTTVNGLIPIAAIRAAQDLELKPYGENVLGVDVGAGGDKNVVAHRHGGVLRIIRRDQVVDTMESCGNLLADLNRTGATFANVDYIGIGRGMVDRAVEQKAPVNGINVAQAALLDDGAKQNKKKVKMVEDELGFVNLRAQAYWRMREAFLAGEIDLDPNDDDLVADLVAIRYKRNSTGKIQVIEKETLRTELGHSPDDGDAAMFTFVPVPLRKAFAGAVW